MGSIDADRLSAMVRAVEKENSKLDEVVVEKSKEIEQYKSLAERLETMPRKLQHRVMVPFGSVGFMPGKIVHTNQVMVLLGDNYFAECSCYDAGKIVERRIEMIENILKDVEKEKKLLRDQLGFAQQLFEKSNHDEIEIREEYNEAEQEKFLEKRRRRKEEKKAAEALSSSQKEQEDMYMQRLDELERMEAEQNELEVNDEDQSIKPPPGVDPKEFQKLLASLDAQDSSDEDNEDEEMDGEESEVDSDDVEDEISTTSDIMKKVTFAKGDALEQTTSILVDEPANAVGRAPSSPTSQASILRNRHIKSPRDEAALEAIIAEENLPRVIPASGDAFSGLVIERNMEEDEPRPSTSTAEPAPHAPRMSRFKLQRVNPQ